MATLEQAHSSFLPLLAMENLRLEQGGVVVFDDLSFKTSGQRLLVLGATEHLFGLITGKLNPTTGRLKLMGQSPRAAIASRQAAAVSFDSAFPPSWTPQKYAYWSGRLSGLSRKQAKNVAKQALHETGLQEQTKPLSHLDSFSRYLTQVAAVLATEAPVLLLKEPLANLPYPMAEEFELHLIQYLNAKNWIFFVEHTPLTSRLMQEADEVVFLISSHQVVQGPPSILASIQRSFFVILHGDRNKFRDQAIAAGASVECSSMHLILSLGPQASTRDIFQWAANTSTTVLSLYPTIIFP
ncbi:hypothetical protein [Pajaroellobacter abortibovis]|uniref:ABC transporter domain-containing protein n=1 Tax=Pajaroellobacter abortibovis TaxID=1882918 RepID=A0A1L6MV51_9BACT|nr:hypothetical protein [Pajaroellobacter abortibovis]APR99337.1 hypothetical protein BCY86_00580 [Pajaroellobacter abortibovis]